MPMPTEMGKIPNFMDSERFKTPTMDWVLNKDQEFYQLGHGKKEIAVANLEATPT